MKHVTVQFHTPLTRTHENREWARNLVENQTGKHASPIELTWTPGVGLVWGYHNEVASLFFVEPEDA